MPSATATATETLTATPRTTLKRHPERGSHERERVHAIIDEAMFWALTTCEIGWNIFSCFASTQFEQ